MLRDKLQFDFSGYKIGTLMRRVRRREMATGNTDLATYIAEDMTARKHAEELLRITAQVFDQAATRKNQSKCMKACSTFHHVDHSKNGSKSAWATAARGAMNVA